MDCPDHSSSNCVRANMVVSAARLSGSAMESVDVRFMKSLQYSLKQAKTVGQSRAYFLRTSKCEKKYCTRKDTRKMARRTSRTGRIGTTQNATLSVSMFSPNTFNVVSAV